MTPQAIAAFATLVSFAQHGNRVDLRLDRGSAELVWISPAAFHFRRVLDGPLAPAAPEPSTAAVEYKIEDGPSAVHLRTRLLDVALAKHGLLVAVNGPGGVRLMEDLTEPRSAGARLSWERRAAEGIRFFGLGPRDDLNLDLRGKAVDSLMPFFFSSSGYGEQHSAPARFDFTAADRYRIEAPLVDYRFLYGPKPKQIFAQLAPAPTMLPWHGPPQTPSWNALRGQLVAAVQEAMSGPFVPRLYFTKPLFTPADLQTRIDQIAALVPDAPESLALFSPFRARLAGFFAAYAIENRDRHDPVWHALPFEFPDDAESARHADEFLLGDEMLVAPICQPGNRRQVYFPPGSWTSFDTGAQYSGRTTASIESESLPVFARDGAIVPFDTAGDAIELHYFLPLGGEFFLLEKDLGAWTQVHAAPAGDILRLEIQSRKDRVYSWVVHRVDRPKSVAFQGREYQWSYDPDRKNLTFTVPVKAGEDNIVHVSW